MIERKEKQFNLPDIEKVADISKYNTVLL